METRLHIGRFELTGRLGAGGMAEVWRAEHAALGTQVAVKVITGSRAFDARYQERFIREVQAVARLNHPGIVRVYDYGKVEGEGGHGIRPGSPFLVMEMADSGTVEEFDVQDFAAVRRILLHVLDALAYSHARGVVHRDIKPGNVLLTSAGQNFRAKLTDFGIAHADDPDTDLTKGSLDEAAGTPDYMPPEQLQGKWRDYGPWTDLYALGCMAWEMVTGRAPFQGVNAIQTAMAHMTDPLPAFEPKFDVPDGFEGWLARTLEKQPHDRFERAADAAFALSMLKRPAATTTWKAPSSSMFIPEPGSTDVFEGGEDETTVLSATMITSWSPTPQAPPAEDSDPYDEEMSTTVLNLSDMSWAQDVQHEEVAEPGEHPPVPNDWRRDTLDGGPVVAGMGLGLFGLREIPFVGRYDERDAIWEALNEVVNRQKPRTVVIGGRSGTGKSRLVQWVTERAEEVGAAVVLRAAHAEVAAGKHGLSHMLERYFVSWRIDEFERVRARISSALERLWDGDERGTSEFIEHESRAIAAVTAPHADGAQEVASGSKEERLASLIRMVRRIAGKRTLILWVDDAQWGDDALELVERVLQNQDPLPVLVLLTVQTDAEPDEAARQRLVQIAHRPTTRQVKLNFLQRDFQLELVKKLAGLNDDGARRVVEATGGNPLFAVQLVGHWIEKGALTPTHSGFSVAQGADAPGEIQGLWTHRITDITSRYGGAAQQRALELAATLGDDVDEIEWQATCIVADVEPHDRLIDELVDQGLAVRFEEGFSFAHKMIGDSVRAEAARRGVLRGHEATCGEVLRTIYAHDIERLAPRVAQHFLRAEMWAEALEPLEMVARAEIAAGNLTEAQEAITQHGRALDALHANGFDRRRVDNWLYQGQVFLRAGNPHDAEAQFQHVMNVASPQRWRRPVALAQRGLGELAANAGRLHEALEAYNRAEGYFGEEAEPHELATLYEARAEAYKASGDPASARADLERALDLFRATGDLIQELNVFPRLAATFLSEGDAAAAREVAEMGAELGKHHGNRAAEAGCWLTLGEVERQSGNFDESRRCYQEAERLDELTGSRHVWVVRTHLAILELAAQNWEVAANRFDELELELRMVGFEGILPMVHLGQAACHVAYGEWGHYDRRWAQAIEEIEGGGLVERDIPWLAQVAGDLCTRRQDHSRARQAYAFAVRYWDTLGEMWRARELRIRIRSTTQH